MKKTILTMVIIVLLTSICAMSIVIPTASAYNQCTLLPNERYDFSLPAGQSFTFNLEFYSYQWDPRQILEYNFAVNSFNTRIQLYRNNVLLQESILGLVFTPEPTGAYKIVVSSLNGNALNGRYARFYTTETVNFFSYLDDYVDYTSSIYTAMPHLNNMGIYVKHRCIYYNTLSNLNTKYVMMATKGNSDWSIHIDDSTVITEYDIPDMTGVEIALYSAGYSTKIASKSVVNGADYAIGWQGNLNRNRSRYFTTRFWYYISNGYSVEGALNQAKADTVSHYWYVIFWGSDTVRTPFLFGGNKSMVSDETNAMNYNYDKYINKISTSWVKNKEYIATNNQLSNDYRLIRTINGVMTNEYIIIDAKGNVVHSDNRITDKDIDMLNSSFKILDHNIYQRNNSEDYIVDKEFISEYYYIKINNELNIIHREQYSLKTSYKLESFEETYYNLTNGKFVSDEEFSKYYN